MPDGPADEAVDVGRRTFFRRFAGDVVSAASSAIGALGVLQETSAEAARDLLGATEPPGAATPTGFRSAFRWDGDVCWVVDQRKIPDSIAEYSMRGAAEAAFAIREGVVRGAPVARQLAAIGLALTAHRHRTTRPYARRAQIRGSANALRAARPALGGVADATERMLDALEAAGGLAGEGDRIAAALRAEAEAIILEATTDHGLLAAALAATLPATGDAPLRVLVHGHTGVLAGGQYGTGLAGVIAAHHAGRLIHVHVAETRPELLGSRLAAWELREAGVSFDVVTDSAAATLIARGEVDAVVLGAERVAANGDVLVVTGGYALSTVADRHDVAVLVAAPTSTVDLASPAGASFPEEHRRAEAVTTVRGVRVAVDGAPALDPSLEVLPAALVGRLVSDAGVLGEPFGLSLPAALADAADRHAVLPRFAGAVERAGVERAAAAEPADAADEAAAEPADAAVGGDPGPPAGAG